MDALALLVGVTIGLAAGALLAWTLFQARAGRFNDRVADRLSDTFRALASDALQRNNESFIQLADQNLQKHLNESKSDLDARKQAVEKLVEPLSRALQRMESERKTDQGSITAKVEALTRSSHDLTRETRNLSQALRTPQVRGRWGEMTLRRVAELAGMVERCDFFEQEEIEAGSSRRRPDMLIRLPSDRTIVVDAKTPLDGYIRAVEAPSEEARAQAMEDHARQVGNRVRELSEKAYWDALGDTPEFVVLFLPGEFFLSPALERTPDLMETAMRSRVVVSTPSTFIALLLTVAHGWREVTLAENARQVRQLGVELHGRLVTWAKHLDSLRSGLESAVKAFNAGVGSLEGRVLVSARRFRELGVGADEEIPEVQSLDEALRQPSSTPAEPGNGRTSQG